MASVIAASMTSGTNTASNSELDARILNACLRCIERWGINKTSLEDVAREAGCSRATVYRLFPGGKDSLIQAVADSEASTFFAALSDDLKHATTLEDHLVLGVGHALRRLIGHPALQALLTYEPDAPAAHLVAPSMDGLVRPGTVFTAAQLAPWFDRAPALEAAERVVRIVLSYASCPSDRLDPHDEESVRHLVDTFVMPSIMTLARQSVPT
ncbi:MAG: TetR/AcrR family transcriptional regulator [Acidimicrobiales bacterium]